MAESTLDPEMCPAAVAAKARTVVASRASSVFSNVRSIVINEKKAKINSPKASAAVYVIVNRRRSESLPMNAKGAGRRVSAKAVPRSANRDEQRTHIVELDLRAQPFDVNVDDV